MTDINDNENKRKAVVTTAIIVTVFIAGWLGIAAIDIDHSPVYYTTHQEINYVSSPLFNRWLNGLFDVFSRAYAILTIIISGMSVLLIKCGVKNRLVRSLNILFPLSLGLLFVIVSMGHLG